jgi:hypothetical protein
MTEKEEQVEEWKQCDGAAAKNAPKGRKFEMSTSDLSVSSIDGATSRHFHFFRAIVLFKSSCVYYLFVRCDEATKIRRLRGRVL